MYASGTATDPNDLLTKLITFLTGAGWTSNLSLADGTGWRAHVSKGSQFVNLHSNVGATNPWAFTPPNGLPDATLGVVHLYCGTAFDGAAAWNAQAGGPIGHGQSYNVGAAMQLPAGAITAYHFFSDAADNVFVVVERTAGVFAFMGWGHILTAGAITGDGQFFCGSCSPGNIGHADAAIPGSKATTSCPFAANGDAWVSGANSFVHCDVDTFTSKWLGMCATAQATQPTYGGTGRAAMGAVPNLYLNAVIGPAPDTMIAVLTNLCQRSTSQLNAQANLLPVPIWAGRDAGGASIIGWVPDVFACSSVGDGFGAGDVVSLGADDYMLFPNFAIRKV